MYFSISEKQLSVVKKKGKKRKEKEDIGVILPVIPENTATVLKIDIIIKGIN